MNPKIAKGLSQSFKATGTFADGTSKDISGQVTWSVGKASVAHMLVQLATGDAPGATSIVATSGSISGSTTLTVTAATLQTITVAPTTATIPSGATQQFTATGNFSDGTSRDLTGSVIWSSTATFVANVDAGGLASSLAPGSTTVTATSGIVSGHATLHVTDAVLQSISIVPADGQLPKGLQLQLIANGSLSDGTTMDLSPFVSWLSDTPSVATVALGGGLAFAVDLGTTNVTATLGNLSGSTTLTVIAAALTSISVAPPNPTVPNGLSRAFTATGQYSDGTTQDLTTSALWTSDTTSVATIAADGTATAKSPGTSSIAAALVGVSGSTVLTVSAATLVSIEVTPGNPSINTGTGLQFSAVGTYSDTTTFDLTAFATWGSGAPGAATISTGGLAFGIAAGSSLISATQGAISGFSTLFVLAPGNIWTTRASAPALGVALYGVAASSNEVVAVGLVTIVASPDGLAWTSQTAAGTLNGVTWTGAEFAAVGWLENTPTNLAQTSPDGATWSTATWTTPLQPLFGVAWSGSTLAAVGYNGGVFSSPDAITWTAQSSGTGAYLHRVAWSGASFVAVGDGGTVLTSPDGVTWTTRTSGTPNALNGIVWDGARFLAVGSGGTILTSPDGITWTPRTSSTANALNGVASSGAGYVAVGDGGAVVTSPDGTTWSAAASGTSLPLNDVTWSGSRFVAVGGITSGIILTSP